MNRGLRRLALALLFLLPMRNAAASDVLDTKAAALPNLALRNTAIIGAGAGLVALYGMNNWWHEGFGGGLRVEREGWFGAGTHYGGADKLGHSYGNYAGVRLLTPVFEAAGNNPQAAVMLAALSTFGVYTAIEIADGYSRSYSFSPEDAIANAAGAALGVVLERNPALDAIYDFRLHYRRSARASGFDPFGDYSGQKYLLVIKADGFAPLRGNGFTRYLELVLGYGARGFEEGGLRRRSAYIGVSLNLSRLLADGAYGGKMHSTNFQRATDRVFELVQFPSVGYARRSLD